MITNDQLKELYNRADEYCRIKFEDEPDYIRITEDGNLEATFSYSCRGEWNEDTQYIALSELSKDLDEVRAERLEAQRIENAKREKQRLIDKAHREERELRERKRTYENLKKEFGDTE